MILVRYEAHTGETIDILPEKFQPLSYADLVIDYKNRDKQYSMQIDAKSVESSKMPGQAKGPATVSMPITFRKPLSIFALVDGGWLPLPLLFHRTFWLTAMLSLLWSR